MFRKLITPLGLAIVELVVIVGVEVAGLVNQHKTNKKIVDYYQNNLAKDLHDIANGKNEDVIIEN